MNTIPRYMKEYANAQRKSYMNNELMQNRRETKQRIRQRTEHLYYMKQRISGTIMAAIGIVSPFILDGDATFSLIALPLGIFLMMTREKVMTF